MTRGLELFQSPLIASTHLTRKCALQYIGHELDGIAVDGSFSATYITTNLVLSIIAPSVQVI